MTSVAAKKQIIDFPQTLKDLARTSDFSHGQDVTLHGNLGLVPNQQVLVFGDTSPEFVEHLAQSVGSGGKVYVSETSSQGLPLYGTVEHIAIRPEEMSDYFEDASLDLVCFGDNIFRYVVDGARALVEIKRVLAAGGRVGFDCDDAEVPAQVSRLLAEAA